MECVLGLDFGGTKLAAGVVDAQSGQVISQARCATPSGGRAASLTAMLGLAQELIGQLGADARLSGCGVSFGGPVEADGRTVRLSMHVSGWEAFPLAETLEATLGLPAAVANDGDAAALAEFRFGAGRGVRHLVYLTVSTGIGGGIIIDGHLHRGERAWAGEIGHIVLKPDGPDCPCGRNGCLESLSSGLSIAREARLHLPQLGANPTAQDVLAAATAGDQAAQAVWDEAMGWLGIGVSSAANIINPGRVVLGGGLTQAGEALFAPVRRVVAVRALDPALEVVPAALGSVVGILGGAALVIGN